MRTSMIRAPGMLASRLGGRLFELPRHRRLSDLEIDENVIALVPASVIRENVTLPVDFDGETVTLATPHDTDVMLQDKLRFILNRNVRFVWRDYQEVIDAIDHFCGRVEGESADSMLQEFTDTAIDFTETALADEPILAGMYMSSNSPIDERLKRACYERSVRAQSTSSTNRGEGFMRYTIEEGNQVLAHRANGRIDILTGPRRVWKWFARFEVMRHHVAHPAQYLSIRYRDGHEETKLGPTELWQDPRQHQSIEVHDCLDLAAKEAVVVYDAAVGDRESGDKKGNETIRRVFNGPGLFAPQPGQWLHRFSWHAANGGSRGEEKRPGGSQFQKLCLMPDQMYHDVHDVRTGDDAVLTIRLMIFFELVDIERMLDTTHDPIGDFINAATSDVVEFTGKRSFDAFKQQTEQLNELSTYHQLLHRAEQCGYKINNVVYRGYGAPESLQAMHDEAIQSRTRLRLERATEEQAQDVEDYRLTCQVERSTRRREEQMTEVQHDLEVKSQQAAAELRQRQLRESFQRDQKRAEQELAFEIRQKSDEQEQAHLAVLRSMEVDLTKYLTQARADQIIELRGRATVAPEIHLENVRGAKVPR